jgi:hypothetical protein
MTFEPPSSDRGGSGGGASHDGRATGGIAPVRAAVVIIIFVVAAIALVAVGTRPTVSGEAATSPTTTTTTTKTSPTTTTTTVAPGAVKVVVANATSTSGLAGHYTSVLAAHGWAMQTATDATTTQATSVVYYAAGFQAQAATIVSQLPGLKPTAAQPLTAAVPVPGVTGDNIVVVIGADLVAGA